MKQEEVRIQEEARGFVKAIDWIVEEVLPEFTGGTEELIEYIKSNSSVWRIRAKQDLSLDD